MYGYSKAILANFFKILVVAKISWVHFNEKELWQVHSVFFIIIIMSSVDDVIIQKYFEITRSKKS